MTVRIGTSGWVYPHWRGIVYPADLPPRAWFDAYARMFDTVEINNSFYRLPSAATCAAWRDQAPVGFCYAVKASRFLTHMKKLADPEEPLRRFFERADQLGSALGPVLYQLPPHWHVNLDRFAQFLGALPDPPRACTWFCSSRVRRSNEPRNPGTAEPTRAHDQTSFDIIQQKEAYPCATPVPANR